MLVQIDASVQEIMGSIVTYSKGHTYIQLYPSRVLVIVLRTKLDEGDYVEAAPICLTVQQALSLKQYLNGFDWSLLDVENHIVEEEKEHHQ